MLCKLLRGTALLLVGIVMANCANTYNVRAETDVCTETRRACMADCDTEACVAACSADESACRFTVEQENEVAEGTADRQTTGLHAGLRAGLNAIAIVSGAILTISILGTVDDYVSTLK